MRSMVESFDVFARFFQNAEIRKQFKGDIKVLDIGAGAGPEIIGFIKALKAENVCFKSIHFDMVDANEYMKEHFDAFYKLTLKDKRISYDYHLIDLNGKRLFSEGLNELDNNLGMDYDLTMSFKFVNELYRMNNREQNYKLLLEFALDHSTDEPFIFISDVCDKANNKEFFPIIFNNETKLFLGENKNIREILPVSCHANRDKCRCLENGCFTSKRMGYRFGDKGEAFDFFSTNHRVITSKNMADKISNFINKSNSSVFCVSKNKTNSKVCNDGAPVFVESEVGHPNAFDL